MKLILKNSSLIFKGVKLEPVSVGPSNSDIIAFTNANSGDLDTGFKGAISDCNGTNINKVTKITFRVSDGGDGVNRGVTAFFKMTIENDICTALQEVARYTYNASELGTLKTLDVDVMLGVNDYLALGGNFYYTTPGGTINARGVGQSVSTFDNKYGYNIEGYKIVSE